MIFQEYVIPIALCICVACLTMSITALNRQKREQDATIDRVVELMLTFDPGKATGNHSWAEVASAVATREHDTYVYNQSLLVMGRIHQAVQDAYIPTLWVVKADPKDANLTHWQILVPHGYEESANTIIQPLLQARKDSEAVRTKNFDADPATPRLNVLPAQIK